jgi:hypothetical protein
MQHEEATFNEILLSDDGRLFRRIVEQRAIIINEDAVFAAMKEGQKTRIRDALFIGKEPVGLCVITDKTAWVNVHATIPLRFVRFNTNFRMEGEIMVPVFEKPTNDKPRFNVDWDIDVACSGKVRLWLLVLTRHRPGDPRHHVANCYLAATSESNLTYRIPLSNVYDDCRICMGDYDAGGDSLPQALECALNQFLISPWNSDLRKSSAKSDAFFRFKPKNEGVETLPVEGQWNNLCERVSVPALESLCLPNPEGSVE